MGRIKTAKVKRMTKEIMKEHKDVFTEEFAKNKELVNKTTDVKSKKLRNVVSGYITRLQKRQEKL